MQKNKYLYIKDFSFVHKADTFHLETFFFIQFKIDECFYQTLNLNPFIFIILILFLDTHLQSISLPVLKIPFVVLTYNLNPTWKTSTLVVEKN